MTTQTDSTKSSTVVDGWIYSIRAMFNHLMNLMTGATVVSPSSHRVAPAMLSLRQSNMMMMHQQHFSFNQVVPTDEHHHVKRFDDGEDKERFNKSSAASPRIEDHWYDDMGMDRQAPVHIVVARISFQNEEYRKRTNDNDNNNHHSVIGEEGEDPTEDGEEEDEDMNNVQKEDYVLSPEFP